MKRGRKAHNASDTAKAPIRRRRWRRRLIGLLALVMALLVMDYWAYPYGMPAGGRSFNHGENGLWLRYTWYFGRHSDAEVRALASQLQSRQIRYAYFHVRSVKRDGNLAFHYPKQARQLTEALHRYAPGVKCIAWIYAGNRRGEGEVDLGSPAVRRTMVQEAVRLTTTYGFDGVQWDYEMCDDGDGPFLALMQETRAAVPPGKLLSTATPMWLPAPLRHWGWSDAYFAKVAATCDQMTVMCYDSGFYLPRSYVWLVRQQAIHVTQAAERGNRNCRILLGIPTYDQGLFSHNPRAENIGLALRGVREGLIDQGAKPERFAGVAPFAEYTTDGEKWRVYADLWLGR